MNVSPISYIRIPFQYLQSYSSQVQKNWSEKYESYFKNLQAPSTPNSDVNGSASLTPASGGTAAKIEDVAAKNLPEAEVKSAIPQTTSTTSTSQILSLDPKTTLKKLDNGISYYIRQNDYPSKETASLRLVVSAGSTDEQEHERGLAHFVEHMLFHETEYLGRQDVKRFLESRGATGADQNAHTSYNETVYKFDIPLKDPELMDKTFHFLREMATRAKITDSSVEEERAVILDEISDESAGVRYRKKRNAVLLEGTPYPDRRPRGLKEVIQQCTPEQIRAFYKRVYQPQNMALVAVGDFDPKQVEELIQKHFSDIPPATGPQIKHEFSPIERKEPLYVCHFDPESTTSILQVHYPLSTSFEPQVVTTESVRQGLINALNLYMFNKRLQEIITDSGSPAFYYANAVKRELVDNIFYFRLTAAAHDGEIPSAYKRLLLELQRVSEHGFLEQELELAKKTLKTQLEQAKKEKNHISNKEFASDCIAHFIDGSPYLDQEEIVDCKLKLLESITVPHINIWNKILTFSKGRVISTCLPEAIAETVSPEILRKVEEEAASEPVAPYTDNFVARPLLRHVPTPGKIVKTSVFEKVGVTKWKLENGMNVYVRPSKHKEDSILIYASSLGGELSVPLEKRAAVDMAAEVYAKSGLAGMTPSQLNKSFAGKSIIHKIIIGNYSTALLTSSSKDYLDSAFELMHIAYTDRNFKKDAFDTLKKGNLSRARYNDNDPETLLSNTEVALCTQNHPRFLPVTKEEYEKANYRDAEEFLNAQFQNPANFDVVITGNVDLEATRQLVEKYLAGIPVQGNKADFASIKYPAYEYPSGIVAKEVVAGIASPCQAHTSFPAPAQDTRESRQLGAWTAGLLTAHLFDRLRFIKAENYSVDCHYAITSYPGQEKTDPSSMELEISGLPENIHHLQKTVMEEIKRLQNEGFTEEEIASYKAQVKESYRKALDLDSTWMSMIAGNARWDGDLNMLVDNYHAMLDKFNTKTAQEYLTKLLPLDRYVQVTLLPKKPEPSVSDKI